MPRFSVDSGDPGYKNYEAARANRKRLDIYLDGVLQRQVVTADEEAGFILRNRLNERGEAFLDELRENVVREKIRGAVEVRSVSVAV